MHTLSRIFSVPQNTISSTILRATLEALKQYLVKDPNTRTIKLPTTADDLSGLLAAFHQRFRIPCIVGAVDGSLIPMRKPSAIQAGGDTAAYWCYKGHVASLLLAVCDANGSFWYINAGSPGSAGDAGLWSRCRLNSLIEEGLFKKISITLQTEEGEFTVHPCLVGDSAFPLNASLLKAYGDPRRGEQQEFEDSGMAEFNRRVLGARKKIEQAFGMLKGRFVYAARNLFWKCPAFNRDAVMVCCGLHNLFLERNVAYNVAWDQNVEDMRLEQLANGVALPRMTVHERCATAGRNVRDAVRRWIRNGN
jgi:hypothetical protein